jgi:hypothetical protein
MSDEQVERVAKAIQKAHQIHGHNWKEHARAAIAAMQPTPQEAAKVLVAEIVSKQTNYTELLKDQPIGGVVGLTLSLRAIAGEARHD